MIQAKFSLEENQIDFLKTCQQYGFKDKSEMVRVALNTFQAMLQQQALVQSADLYAEIYAEDSDLQALTHHALSQWPE